jgi:hypothetical protein
MMIRKSKADSRLLYTWPILSRSSRLSRLAGASDAFDVVKPRPGRTLAGYAPLLLALAVYALYVLVLLAYARALILFPFDYDQGEGFELYDAIRLARGENIYLDNAVFPYYASNYPPVYRTLLAPLVLIFGPNLWVGRALAFAFVLATGPLLFVAARRVMRCELAPNASEGSRYVLIAWLAALAYFAANYVYHVAPLARAHLPMVCIAVAGILCLQIGLDGGQRRGWTGLGVALLITAGFTKLQAIDALAAGFAYLLIQRWRWGVIALAVGAGVSALISLLIDAVSHGQFLLNVVFANVNEYDIAQTWATYAQWFRLQGVLIVCASAYVLWDVARAVRTRSLRPISIWSMYFAAGGALGMLTGKWGAGPTYLAAAIAASCVCTAGLIARAARALAFASAPMLAALIFLAQAVLNVHLPTSGRFFGVVARVIGVVDAPSSYPPYPYYDSIGYTQLGHLLDRQDAANGWLLVEELRKHPGPVWSEEAMITLHAGKDVVTNPTQLLNLSKNSALDTRDMIARIQRREFGAVVFRAYFYPEDVKSAISEHYATVGSIKINGFDYYLLLPKP